MKRITLLLFCLCLVPALAEEQAPQAFKAYALTDQHGEERSLRPETRTVIMSFEMPLAKSIHGWLATKDAEYLADHQAEYVVDISPMPAFVNKMFAGPKMRKFAFPIIQATAEDFAADYPHKKDAISVFALSEDQQTATVAYVTSVAELEALLEPAPDE